MTPSLLYSTSEGACQAILMTAFHQTVAFCSRLHLWRGPASPTIQSERNKRAQTLGSWCALRLLFSPTDVVDYSQRMGGTNTTKIFISYARKDGADLAQRLQKSLADE
jgi:hypothetical protein